MYRLLILFLIFLLPLQIFAGSIDTQRGFTAQYAQSTQESTQSSAHRQELHAALDLAAQQKEAANECCVFGDDTAGCSLHADLGDETVPAHSFYFVPNRSSHTHAHSNDNVREPPFLPLISPPPRTRNLYLVTWPHFVKS